MDFGEIGEKIGGFLKDVPIIGPIIGGVGDYLSGKATNEANAEQAALNRDFQERMSNTAYQRATTDMKSAGLNPMLAYSQGGGSTPGGSTATMTNPVGPALTSAISLSRANAEVDKLRAETDLLMRTNPSRERSVAAQMNVDEDNAWRSSAQRNAESGHSSSTPMEKARLAELNQAIAAARKAGAEADLRQLEVARARLLNKVYSTADKGFDGVRSFAEYAGENAGKFVNSAKESTRGAWEGYKRFWGFGKPERRRHGRGAGASGSY